MFLNLPLEALILLITSGLNLFFASVIYFKNPKDTTNRLFSLSILFLVLWNISVIFAQNTSENILWVKAAYATSILALITFLYFLKFFPKEDKGLKSPLFYILIYSGLVFSLLIYPTKFLVKLDPFLIIPIQGMDRTKVFSSLGMNFFLFYLIVYVCFVIFIFLKKLKSLSGIEKLRVKYAAVGVIVFLVLALLANLFLPHLLNIKLGNIGPAFSVIMIGFISYAISKYRLFEIRIVLTESFVVIIGFILLIQIFLAESILWKAASIVIFILFIVFAYLLIKSVLREISYREKLQRAYAKLAKLDKAKSEFISIASHQLRAPLSAIKGYMSMILEGSYGPLSRKIKKPLENVYKSNEELISLANNLLNLSRIEAGKITLEKEEVDLNELINDVVDELKIEADKKGLYLRYQTISLPKIKIDPEKIKQVVLNIVDNAIKYTSKGGIRIRTSLLDSKILIEISDTGVGMTKEELDGLFQSFWRGEGGPKLWTGGAGLGLYIAKKFIELHKGEIYAKSQGKGKGSTFYIELPLAK
jgi:signal transduction histidine kinase